VRNDAFVEEAALQLLQDVLVHLLHLDLDLIFDRIGIVVITLRGNDDAFEEKVRENAGMRYPRVLGLDVINPPVVSDVMIEPEYRAAGGPRHLRQYIAACSSC